MEHLDANLDLILRVMESEQKEIINQTGGPMDGGPLFIQLSLSKTWLFAVYEIVRETCDVPCGGTKNRSVYCRDASCFRCNSLKPVKDILARYRVPLAKLQPMGRDVRQRNQLPSIAFNNDDGSIAWLTMTASGEPEEKLSRQEISDYILEMLLKIEK
ncbi:hypothetical protein GGQ68_002668 [Sagittula marina]|uniref:Uncharacterized protein n=1 Tax=Sagittula marina TaxID=943940 RepID=A0A7W6GUG8_9RHOB|nr:hypothetical protein [Sagittula marina]MBB3986329.1 hypothetical protein [Sagittula marina]